MGGFDAHAVLVAAHLKEEAAPLGIDVGLSGLVDFPSRPRNICRLRNNWCLEGSNMATRMAR